MKLVMLCCSLLFLSFRPVTPQNPLTNDVFGTWVGGFGTEEDIKEAIIKLQPGKAVEFYVEEVNETEKLIGSYEVHADSVLIITVNNYSGNGRMQLVGRLNKTKNFVDGYWQCGSYISGSFYLQKQ
ncbi:MAG TPA: hypothetical protein VIQ00_09840 [Chitinophagaceae bacterium]